VRWLSRESLAFDNLKRYRFVSLNRYGDYAIGLSGRYFQKKTLGSKLNQAEWH
jgi:hypothetical protein